MSEDYFDIAWINFDKAILHGQRADGSQVERVLTNEERDQLRDLNDRHDAAMQVVLRHLAGVE